MDGWKVLNRLKNDLAARHIPVHVISTDEDCERGLRRGAAQRARQADHQQGDPRRGVRRRSARDIERAPQRDLLLAGVRPTQQARTASMLALDGVERRRPPSAAAARAGRGADCRCA